MKTIWAKHGYLLRPQSGLQPIRTPFQIREWVQPRVLGNIGWPRGHLASAVCARTDFSLIVFHISVGLSTIPLHPPGAPATNAPLHGASAAPTCSSLWLRVRWGSLHQNGLPYPPFPAIVNQVRRALFFTFTFKSAGNFYKAQHILSTKKRVVTVKTNTAGLTFLLARFCLSD